MSQNDFRFKQFTVGQDRCAMKVGTDGVLLGAWTQPKDAKAILDIGTGTGLIALMLAQRNGADIDAIDIDQEATLQARENFEASPWSDRLHAIHNSIQHYSETVSKRYDLIVSNPPYFIGAHPAPSEARNIARHMDDSLSIEELSSCVKKLLQPQGRFCVILPFMEGMKFIDQAKQEGLFANRITKVKTKADRPEKRLMMEFEMVMKTPVEDELIILEADDSYSQAYVALTFEYYMGLPGKR